MKLNVYNKEGKKIEELNVSESVFGLKRNDDLIHQVFVSIQANQRQPLAHTKTRGERAGSGAKPWKQKGTGRARVGSIRTPIWKKGGIVFGPRKDRNYKKKINKKTKAKAIAMVLSGKVEEEELRIVDKLDLVEKKTKEMSRLIENLKIEGKILMAFIAEEKNLRIYSRNINKITNTLTNQLNVSDMLRNKYLLMTKDSIKFLEKKYGGRNEKNKRI